MYSMFLFFACFILNTSIYGEVNIEPCTSSPFSCLMICNPDLNYSPTETCIPTVSTDWGDGLNWRVDVFNEAADVNCTDFEGWTNIFGSPDYSETLPSPSNDGQVRMWADHISGQEIEGIVTDVNVIQGQSYIVTYLRKIERCTGSDTFSAKPNEATSGSFNTKSSESEGETTDCNFPGWKLDEVHLKLTNNIEITWNITEKAVADGSINRQVVEPVDMDITDEVNWMRHVRCFTADQNWDRLYLHPQQEETAGLIFLQVDDVELIPAQFQIKEEVIYAECLSSPIELEVVGCHEMTDLTIKWRATTDLTGATGWSDLEDFDGEPSISILPSESTMYEVCRVFESDDYQIIGDFACAETCDYVTVSMESSETAWECCLEEEDGTFDIGSSGFTASNAFPLWTDGNNELGVGNPVFVNGDLVIPSGVNITIDDMEFQFSPNGRIVVENGGSLRLIGGKYTNVCETMWPGIQVHGHGMSVPQDLSSGFLYVEGSLIENAVVGIATWAVPLFDFTSMGITSVPDFNLYLNTNALLLSDLGISPAINTGGGRIEVTEGESRKSRFVNCFHGINDSYHRPSSINRINNSIFSASADLLYPFDALNIQTEAGIFSLIKGNIVGGDIHDCQFRNPK
ncbi:MAG: hypothetical protein ACPG5P_03405, partial [Saprospiraceae bacterium]